MDNKHHTSTSKPKSKNKLLQMLPKAMSFGHRVPPFSPGRDLHHNNHHSNTASNKMFFSGPMVPLVPNAARVRRNKNDAVWDEPTSPKVSCIGQIKLGKSNKCPTGKKNKPTASLIPKTSSSLTKEDDKGRISKIKRFFSFSPANTTSRKSHPTAVSAADEHPVTVVSSAAVPSLGQMKKFASSREALGGFDWAAEMKHEEDSPADLHRGYYSDDDTRGAYLRDDDDEDDIIIPFSAPLGLNLKPKKEVNLWKRRTMDPPKPLHLQVT
ncbi:hypothetical protein CARUB_v10020800mg [Capsella rubella]|uniref:Syringolide-induced protein 14-1-1 n=1 Tax=Capsella rubella TaxID=81985 RepID=R0IFP7_9BRAS|nr:uncharacterized protein At1g76070 [Capsella rubella]EOA35588.1 hypothetical protein CARUB_v10020800mg [Capsella rubella]